MGLLHEEGNIVPPIAQAAVQEGYAVARDIVRAIDGNEGDREAFEYWSPGQLVDLGSQFAANDVVGVRFSGFLVSLFWRGRTCSS